MFHTSPEEITPGMIHNFGIAGSCLFFSDNRYVMTASNVVYTYEADFDCVEAWQLFDEEIIKEIADLFDTDLETAEALLDGSKNEWDLEGTTAEKSWELQGFQGYCATKMGYDGCESVDENGTVYIVPMLGREHELNLVSVSK